MSVTLKIPYDPAALKAASEFFAKLAEIPTPEFRRVLSDVEGPGEPARLANNLTVIEQIVPLGSALERLVPVVNGVPTPTPDTGVAPAPGVSSETAASPTVNPVPPAPVIPVPPAEPTVAGPDAATVFGSVPQPPTVDLDSRGLPWDGRIHASSRAKIADGSWRNRKCPAEYQKPQWDEQIAQIEGELRAAMAVPGPIPPCDGLTGSQATVTTGPVPPALVANSTIPPPAAGPVSPPKTFAELNVAITSNAIDRDRVTQAVQAVGLQAYPLLAARPDLIPQVAAILFPPVAA